VSLNTESSLFVEALKPELLHVFNGNLMTEQSLSSTAVYSFIQRFTGEPTRLQAEGEADGGLLENESITSLYEVVEIFERLGIHSKVYKVNPVHLRDLKLPVIVLFSGANHQAFPLVVENIEEDALHYYQFNTGSGKMDLSDFVEKWDGYFLTRKEESDEAIDQYREECIETIEDFLTAEECDYLIDYVDKNYTFNRSNVNTNGRSLESSWRTSESLTVTDRHASVFRNIYERVADYLQVNDSQIEDLQVIRYKENQQYKPHLDPAKENDRVYTVILYLNDDFVGGETYFPMLDLKIKPKKGKSLCFLNRDSSNQVISYSKHAGLPVTSGIKYICNIWIGA
jgi:hypothetical protein